MKKTEDKKLNTILIGSTVEETQFDEKFAKKFFRAVLIICLFSIMIFSFICVFSKHNYISVGEYNYVGIANTDSFYQVNSGDLLKIRTKSNIKEFKEGDIVYFSSSVENGSGKFVKSVKNIVTLENNDGEEFNVSAISAVGVQVNKIGVLGWFVWFFTSLIGAMVISMILLTYVLYLTFSRINFENTQHGKELLSAYKKLKKEQKTQRNLAKHLVQVENVDHVFVEMLYGDFDANQQKFDQFDAKMKVSNQEKYKFILFNLHENFMEKINLNSQEKRMISSIVELLGNVEHIDSDIEYMIVDLLLKSKLVSFDVDKFIDSINKFFNKKIDQDDILNFGSIYYIMVKKNPLLFLTKNKKLTYSYVKKAGEFGENTRKMARNIVIGIINV